jgi:hypothetical protein
LICSVWREDFSYIFSGENLGENSAENFSPKMLGKKWNVPQKKFRKIVFPRNSAEFSAESDYSVEKNARKIGPRETKYPGRI